MYQMLPIIGRNSHPRSMALSRRFSDFLLIRFVPNAVKSIRTCSGKVSGSG